MNTNIYLLSLLYCFLSYLSFYSILKANGQILHTFLCSQRLSAFQRSQRLHTFLHSWRTLPPSDLANPRVLFGGFLIHPPRSKLYFRGRDGDPTFGRGTVFYDVERWSKIHTHLPGSESHRWEKQRKTPSTSSRSAKYSVPRQGS